jgi:transcriptional regulator with XRE-family HTH domain
MSHWISKLRNPIDFEVLEESALAMAQSVIQNAINDAQLSQSDLSRRMRCNRSVVSRILNGNHNLTIKTMARALAACGSEVRFQAVPIEWNWSAIPDFPEEKKATAHAVSKMS